MTKRRLWIIFPVVVVMLACIAAALSGCGSKPHTCPTCNKPHLEDHTRVTDSHCIHPDCPVCYPPIVIQPQYDQYFYRNAPTQQQAAFTQKLAAMRDTPAVAYTIDVHYLASGTTETTLTTLVFSSFGTHLNARDSSNELHQITLSLVIWIKVYK